MLLTGLHAQVLPPGRYRILVSPGFSATVVTSASASEPLVACVEALVSVSVSGMRGDAALIERARCALLDAPPTEVLVSPRAGSSEIVHVAGDAFGLSVAGVSMSGNGRTEVAHSVRVTLFTASTLWVSVDSASDSVDADVRVFSTDAWGNADQLVAYAATDAPGREELLLVIDDALLASSRRSNSSSASVFVVLLSFDRLVHDTSAMCLSFAMQLVVEPLAHAHAALLSDGTSVRTVNISELVVSVGASRPLQMFSLRATLAEVDSRRNGVTGRSVFRVPLTVSEGAQSGVVTASVSFGTVLARFAVELVEASDSSNVLATCAPTSLQRIVNGAASDGPLLLACELSAHVRAGVDYVLLLEQVAATSALATLSLADAARLAGIGNPADAHAAAQLAIEFAVVAGNATAASVVAVEPVSGTLGVSGVSSSITFVLSSPLAAWPEDVVIAPVPGVTLTEVRGGNTAGDVVRPLYAVSRGQRVTVTFALQRGADYRLNVSCAEGGAPFCLDASAWSQVAGALTYSTRVCECHGRGSCDDVILGADVCVCQPPFAGAHCEACVAGMRLVGAVCVDSRECAADTCSGHGECVQRNGSVACLCDEGFATHHGGAWCASCAPGFTGSAYPVCAPAVAEDSARCEREDDAQWLPTTLHVPGLLGPPQSAAAWDARQAPVYLFGTFAIEMMRPTHVIVFEVPSDTVLRVYMTPHDVDIDLWLYRVVDPSANSTTRERELLGLSIGTGTEESLLETLPAGAYEIMLRFFDWSGGAARLCDVFELEISLLSVAAARDASGRGDVCTGASPLSRLPEMLADLAVTGNRTVVAQANALLCVDVNGNADPGACNTGVPRVFSVRAPVLARREQQDDTAVLHVQLDLAFEFARFDVMAVIVPVANATAALDSCELVHDGCMTSNADGIDTLSSRCSWAARLGNRALLDVNLRAGEYVLEVYAVSLGVEDPARDASRAPEPFAVSLSAAWEPVSFAAAMECTVSPLPSSLNAPGLLPGACAMCCARRSPLTRVSCEQTAAIPACQCIWRASLLCPPARALPASASRCGATTCCSACRFRSRRSTWTRFSWCARRARLIVCCGEACAHTHARVQDDDASRVLERALADVWEEDALAVWLPAGNYSVEFVFHTTFSRASRPCETFWLEWVVRARLFGACVRVVPWPGVTRCACVGQLVERALLQPTVQAVPVGAPAAATSLPRLPTDSSGALIVPVLFNMQQAASNGSALTVSRVCDASFARVSNSSDAAEVVLGRFRARTVTFVDAQARVRARLCWHCVGP